MFSVFRYDHVRKEPKQSNSNYGENYASASQSNSKHESSGPKPMTLKKEDTSGVTSRMVTLKKHGQSEDSGLGDEMAQSPTLKYPTDWVKAAEFIPGQIWKGSGMHPVAL